VDTPPRRIGYTRRERLRRKTRRARHIPRCPQARPSTRLSTEETDGNTKREATSCFIDPRTEKAPHNLCTYKRDIHVKIAKKSSRLVAPLKCFAVYIFHNFSTHFPPATGKFKTHQNRLSTCFQHIFHAVAAFPPSLPLSTKELTAIPQPCPRNHQLTCPFRLPLGGSTKSTSGVVTQPWDITLATIREVYSMFLICFPRKDTIWPAHKKHAVLLCQWSAVSLFFPREGSGAKLLSINNDNRREGVGRYGGLTSSVR
jgi:hypothetical protein